MAEQTLDRISRALKPLTCCAIAAIAMLCLYLTEPSINGVGHALLRYLLITCIPLFLLYWVLDRRSFRFTPPMLGLLAFGLIGVVSAWRPGVLFAGREWAQWYLLATVFFLMCSQLARSDQMKWLLLTALLSTGLSLAVFGLDQWLYQFDELLAQVQSGKIQARLAGMPEGLRRAYMARVNSREVFATFLNPNTYGALMGVMLLIFAVLTLECARLSRTHKRLKALAVICAVSAALCTAGLVLSHSKGTWAALAVAALYLFCVQSRASRKLKAGLVAVFIVAVIAAVMFTSVLDRSIDVRRGYWSGAAGIISEAPLTGVGPGNFGRFYPQHKPLDGTEVQNPHNVFLRIWAELGLLALVVYCGSWALFVLRRPRERDISVNADPEVAVPLRAAIAVHIIVIALMGLFFRVWHECSPVATVFMITTISMGPVLFFLLRDRPFAAFAGLRNAIYAVVVFALVHSFIDLDLGVPGFIVIVLTLASLVAHEARAIRVPRRATVAVAAVLAVGWAMVYVPWGMRNLDCRSLEARIGDPRDVKRDELKQALDLSLEGEQRFPTNGAFLLAQVELYQRMGRAFREDMLAAQLKLARLRRTDAAAWSHLALMYAEMRRWPEARQYLRMSIDLYPTNPRYRFYLARSEHASGAPEQARRTAADALSLNNAVVDRNVRLSTEEAEELRRIAGIGNSP